MLYSLATAQFKSWLCRWWPRFGWQKHGCQYHPTGKKPPKYNGQIVHNSITINSTNLTYSYFGGESFHLANIKHVFLNIFTTFGPVYKKLCVYCPSDDRDIPVNRNQETKTCITTASMGVSAALTSVLNYRPFSVTCRSFSIQRLNSNFVLLKEDQTHPPRIYTFPVLLFSVSVSLFTVAMKRKHFWWDNHSGCL